MEKKYILALDQGTTSSRAILFDHDGSIVAKAQKSFQQIYPKPGWVEQDPMQILESQYAAISELLSQTDEYAPAIASIGITNQRETTVVWEKSTGKPIYNAIGWQCRRTSAFCEELKRDGLEKTIGNKTGLLIDAYFSGTKIAWILENVNDARDKALHGDLLFGTVDTWLIWNLTGGKMHVTDYTNASRTMLFDIHGLNWDKALCDRLGIPMSILPAALPSGSDFGCVTAEIPGLASLAGVPICAAAGDQQSSLFGQGCFKPGDSKNTYGTGCFLLMNTGDQSIRSQNRLLSTVACGTGPKAEYALEGSVFSAGSVIQWLRDELGLIGTAHECDTLAESVPDAGGTYLVPAFTGLGAPYWDMYARGTLIGLTRGTTKAHIARSVLEAIAYQVTDLLTAMQADTGIKINELRVDGGACVSDVMMQFQADMLNVSVNRPENVETTALGAAMLAGLTCGFWSDKRELSAMRKVNRVFDSQMDRQKRMNYYEGWKKAVQRSLHWEDRS